MRGCKKMVDELLEKCKNGSVVPSDFGCFVSIYGGVNVLDKFAKENAFGILTLCLSVLRLDCKLKDDRSKFGSYFAQQISEEMEHNGFQVYKESFSKKNFDLNTVVDLTEKLIQNQVDPKNWVWRIPLVCLEQDVEAVDSDNFLSCRVPEIIKVLESIKNA